MILKNIGVNWDMVFDQKEAVKIFCLEGNLDEARAAVEKLKVMQAILQVAGGHYDEATKTIGDCSKLFGNLDWWEDLEDEEKLRELLYEVRYCF